MFSCTVIHATCLLQIQFKEMEPEDQLLAASTPAEVRAAKKAMAAKEAAKAKAAAEQAAAERAAATMAKQPLHEVQEKEPSHKERKRRTKSRWGCFSLWCTALCHVILKHVQTYYTDTKASR